MKTLDERKSEIRRVLCECFPGVGGLSKGRMIDAVVERVASEAFPELFGPNPTMWLAPMNPTPEMKAAGGQVGNIGHDFSHEVYHQMRDAFLKAEEEK